VRESVRGREREREREGEEKIEWREGDRGERERR